MRYVIWLCLFLSASSFAKDIDIAKHFEGLSGCFALYDIDKNTIQTQYIADYTPPPALSTKFVDLSSLDYFQDLLPQPKKLKKNPMHAIAFCPVKYIARQPETYADATLCDQLKGSVAKQISFLKSYLADENANAALAKNDKDSFITIDNSTKGWELYGKTGSGSAAPQNNLLSKTNPHLQDGWFVGFIEKEKTTYLVVLNFKDIEKNKMANSASERARNITKEILTDMDMY